MVFRLILGYNFLEFKWIYAIIKLLSLKRGIKLHDLFVKVVENVATIIEFMGLFVVIYAVGKSFLKLIFVEKFDFLLAQKDLILNGGLSTALEIFLAAEILKTLTADSFTKLIQVGGLVIIRIAIALLVHWEGEQKEKLLTPEEIEDFEHQLL